MSWRHLEDVFKTSWKRLEDALKRPWRRFEDVLKTSSKRLEDVLKTSWKRLEDVLKTYSQDEYIGLDQDVLKTSSEDEDERRLHQDECLLGSYSITLHVTFNNSIKANERKHLRRQISLVHCRGHDCIMLLFYFDGFYDNHRWLLSKNFYFR